VASGSECLDKSPVDDEVGPRDVAQRRAGEPAASWHWRADSAHGTFKFLKAMRSRLTPEEAGVASSSRGRRVPVAAARRDYASGGREHRLLHAAGTGPQHPPLAGGARFGGASPTRRRSEALRQPIRSHSSAASAPGRRRLQSRQVCIRNVSRMTFDAECCDFRCQRLHPAFDGELGCAVSAAAGNPHSASEGGDRET
jgi:hypothetical protein